MTTTDMPEPLLWRLRDNVYTATGAGGYKYFVLPSSDPELPWCLLSEAVQARKHYTLELAMKSAQATEDLVVLGDRALLNGHQELADATRRHLISQRGRDD